jgi:hypothetical protein
MAAKMRAMRRGCALSAVAVAVPAALVDGAVVPVRFALADESFALDAGGDVPFGAVALVVWAFAAGGSLPGTFFSVAFVFAGTFAEAFSAS